MVASLFPPKSAARAQTGLKATTLLGSNATATRAPTSRNTASTTSKQTARGGAPANVALNAGSLVRQFVESQGVGTITTHPLSLDGDFIALVANVQLAVTSQSVSTDILNGISQMQIIGPDGPIITMQPSTDFYLFQQRWGQYGVQPTLVSTTVTTLAATYSGNYYISGVNLPAAKGPYTLVTTYAALLGTATAQTCTLDLSLVVGNTSGNRTNYIFTNLPFTPAASGMNDLAPVAPIQGDSIQLQEVFLTGMTTVSGTNADVNYLQITSQGSTVATQATGNAIYQADVNALSGTIRTSTYYPLLALNTSLVLGKSAHFYMFWGPSTPSTTIRTGFYWFD